MAIALRAGSTIDNAGIGGSNAGPINVPTGVVNGDLLILLIGGGSNSITITGPSSGWTKIAQVSASNETIAAFWRRANNEPASYLYSTSNIASSTSAMMMAYYDTGGGTVSYGSFATNVANSSLSVNTPAFTPNDASVDNYEVVLHLAGNASSVTISPIGYIVDAWANCWCYGLMTPVKKGQAAPIVTFTVGSVTNWPVLSLSLYNSGTPTTQPVGLRAAVNQTIGGGGAASVTIPAPTNVVAGDLLVAFISDWSNPPPQVPPSGWTKVYGEHNFNSINAAIWTKVATNSEPANYTWTLTSGTGQWYTALWALYNDNGGAVTFDTATELDIAGNVTTATGPTLTPAKASELVWALWLLGANPSNPITFNNNDAFGFKQINQPPTQPQQFSYVPAEFFTQATATATTARSITTPTSTYFMAFQMAFGGTGQGTSGGGGGGGSHNYPWWPGYPGEL